MRKWGIVISVFYAVIVLALLMPLALLLVGDLSPLEGRFYEVIGEGLQEWIVWVPIVAVIAGQIVLLFLSADTSQKRLKPKAHIAVACITTAMLFGILSVGAITSLEVAVSGESTSFSGRILSTKGSILLFWVILWLFWTLVFYLFYRNSSQVTTRAITWLLRGSVLELLIAVPSHVIVRRRHDCCAPIVTSFGITSGIAIMLLAFGPSVYFLYKKRLDAHATRKST